MNPSLPEIALSVRQPWAWAIFHGKDVENRSVGAVRHGMRPGSICIHASKGMTQVEYEYAREIIQKNGVECPAPADLVRGAIVGTVEVTRIARPGDKRLEGNPWYFGECGLVLAKQAELYTPIPCNGALGYFPWEKQPPATALQAPLPWMVKWQAPPPRCCDALGEVCGLPRGHTLVRSNGCIGCGHKESCHNEASDQWKLL